MSLIHENFDDWVIQTRSIRLLQMDRTSEADG